MSRSSLAYKPPRQRRSHESLERILDAAESLIHERGYDNMTIRGGRAAVWFLCRQPLRTFSTISWACFAPSNSATTPASRNDIFSAFQR